MRSTLGHGPSVLANLIHLSTRKEKREAEKKRKEKKKKEEERKGEEKKKRGGKRKKKKLSMDLHSKEDTGSNPLVCPTDSRSILAQDHLARSGCLSSPFLDLVPRLIGVAGDFVVRPSPTQRGRRCFTSFAR